MISTNFNSSERSVIWKIFSFMIFFTVLGSCKTSNLNQKPNLQSIDKESRVLKVNLSDADSRVDGILTLAEREPRLPVGATGFPRDPWEVMELMESLYAEMNTGLHESVIYKDSNQYEYAYEGEDYQINEKEIKKIKDDFEKTRKEIETLLERPLQSLSKDITELKEKMKVKKSDSKLLAKYLELLPAIYLTTSEAYTVSTRSISSLTHSDLANSYKDTYPQHMADEIKKHFSESEINSFENQFIAKKLASALTFLKGASGKVPKMVLLEDISGFTAVFRSCFGNDCSLRSVPFYALDEKTKVFLIRSQAGGSVKGYLLVTEVAYEGKTYPYVVTVNGSLSTDQVKASVSLVASVLKAPKIVLPDFAKAGAIVNTPAMKEGMVHQGEKVSVKVDMNANWKDISNFTTSKNNTGYTNYYAPESVDTAYLGSVAPVNFTQTLLSDVFKSAATIKSRPIVERAKLAVILKNNLEGSNFTRVIDKLEVTNGQMTAALPLTKIDHDKGLTKEEYDEAKRVLNYGKTDILELHPLSRARVLIGLVDYKNDIQEINFDKEAKDYSKWAAGQLSSDTLPLLDIGSHKKIVWNLFQELTAKIQMNEKDIDAVVKFRPEFARKPLFESIHGSLFSPQIINSMIRESTIAEINRADAEGYTPLMLAVLSGHDSVVKTLLDQGADVNAKSKIGETAVSIAEDWGRKNMLESLIAKGATLGGTNSGAVDSQSVSSAKGRDISGMRDISDDVEDPCDEIKKRME